LACCEGEERDNNFARTPKHNNQHWWAWWDTRTM
jgi:hypothetical protein